jgi:uncharacterized membrane protein
VVSHEDEDTFSGSDEVAGLALLVLLLLLLLLLVLVLVVLGALVASALLMLALLAFALIFFSAALRGATVSFLSSVLSLAGAAAASFPPNSSFCLSRYLQRQIAM